MSEMTLAQAASLGTGLAPRLCRSPTGLPHYISDAPVRSLLRRENDAGARALFTWRRSGGWFGGSCAATALPFCPAGDPPNHVRIDPDLRGPRSV